MKRSGQIYPGILRGLAQQRVFKRAASNKLRGFYRSPSQRGVFVPLKSNFPG